MSDVARKGEQVVHLLPVVGALVVGALLFGSCADDGAGRAEARPAGPTTDLVVTATDRIRFEPDTLTMPVGEETSLTFSAEPGVEHDLVVEDAANAGVAGANDTASDDEVGDDDLHVAHADPGQTTETTFLINTPGSYTVYCSVPGHRESGMTATLTVEDATT